MFRMRSAVAAVLLLSVVGIAQAEDQSKAPSAPPAKVDPIEANDPQFVGGFDALYQKTWGPGAIPEKYKQLAGISISVIEKCDTCLGWHIKEAIRLGAGKPELVEALRLGLLTGGSITIPTVRKAYEIIGGQNVK